MAKLVKNSTGDVSTNAGTFEKIISNGDLTPQQKNNFFKKIKNWNNSSGELGDAANGARKWLDETGLEATKLSEAMDKLGAEAGEEYMAIVGKYSNRTGANFNVDLVNDTLTSMKQTPATWGFSGEVRDLLADQPGAFERIQYLKHFDGADLPAGDLPLLRTIRECRGLPTVNTAMTRYMPVGDAEKFLTNEYTDIQKFACASEDVADLQTKSVSEIKRALRLDHMEGGRFDSIH